MEKLYIIPVAKRETSDNENFAQEKSDAVTAEERDDIVTPEKKRSNTISKQQQNRNFRNGIKRRDFRVLYVTDKIKHVPSF